MNMRLVGTAQRRIGDAINARTPRTNPRSNSFQHQTISKDHCLVLIDGHLQVVRRDKLRASVRDPKEKELVSTQLQYSDTINEKMKALVREINDRVKQDQKRKDAEIARARKAARDSAKQARIMQKQRKVVVYTDAD